MTANRVNLTNWWGPNHFLHLTDPPNFSPGLADPFQWMQKLHRNSHHPSLPPLLPRTPRCACIGWDIHNPIKSGEAEAGDRRSFSNPNRTQGLGGLRQGHWFRRNFPRAKVVVNIGSPTYCLCISSWCVCVCGFLISCGFLGDVSPESKPYDY